MQIFSTLKFFDAESLRRNKKTMDVLRTAYGLGPEQDRCDKATIISGKPTF